MYTHEPLKTPGGPNVVCVFLAQVYELPLPGYSYAALTSERQIPLKSSGLQLPNTFMCRLGKICNFLKRQPERTMPP